jgi:hypothetical protein
LFFVEEDGMIKRPGSKVMHKTGRFILKHCLGKEVKRKGQGKHLRSCAGGRFCMGKHEKFLRDVPNLSFCTNFFM